jgi:hypothetical protein
MTIKTLGKALAIGAVFAAIGCGMPRSPRVHFAEATDAQLNQSDNQETWYEFRKGDDVPIAMLFTGVVEGGTPVHAKAKQTFWLVLRKGQEPHFSFDGENVMYSQGGMAAIALTRIKEENQVGVVTYIGKPEDMPAELKGK